MGTSIFRTITEEAAPLKPYLLNQYNPCMHIITVAMFRTQREKDRFAEAITEDAVKLLGVKGEEVIKPRGNWYASGIRL